MARTSQWPGVKTIFPLAVKRGVIQSERIISQNEFHLPAELICVVLVVFTSRNRNKFKLCRASPIKNGARFGQHLPSRNSRTK